MATREQLERALVGAHNAGDTVAAKRLANEIKRMSSASSVAGPQAQQPAQPPQQKANKLLGAARSATEGLTLGWGDEAGIGLAAIAAKISGYGEGKPISDIYREMKTSYAAEQGAFEKESPYLAGGAKLAGGLATGIATAPLMAPAAAASTAARIGTYGATGAGFGAVTGAGEAAPDDTVGGAIRGGVVGGAFGAAIPAVGMGIQRGFQGAANRLPSRAPTVAARQVAGDIRAAGLDEAQVAKQLREMGPNATLADIEALRPRAAVVAQLPGAGQRESAKFVLRNEDAGLRMRQVVEQVNKGKVDLGAFVDDVVEKSKSQASPAYEAVFSKFDRASNPITTPQNPLLNRPPTSEKLHNLMANSIVKKAASSVGIELDQTKPMGLREWDAVRQGLDDIGYGKTATNVMGRVEGDVRTARMVSKAINTELDKLVEKAGAGSMYKDARGIYSGLAKTKEAAEEGAKFWTMTPQQVERKMAALSASERDAFKLAGMQRLYDEVGKATEGGSVYARVFNNANNKDKIRALLQDDESFKVLENALSSEKTFNTTFRKLTQGSDTASRILGAEAMTTEQLNPVISAAQGNFGTAATQWIMSKVRGLKIPEAQRKELADILMTPGPAAEQKLREVMNALPANSADRRALAQILASQIGMASGRGDM
jgi:hypothetical protein